MAKTIEGRPQVSTLGKGKASLALICEDLPLGLKREGIVALLNGRDYPLGWFAAVQQAKKERRTRRRVAWKALRAGLKHIFLSRAARVGLVLLLGLGIGWWLIWVGYNKEWSGWKAKNLWDWMQLLIVPLSLAVIAYLFRREESKTSQDIAAEHYQQKLLQDYFDRISQLIVDKHLDESPDPRNRAIARVVTLSVLRRSDALRRGEILKFLKEASLIQQGSAIIDLHGADFSGAALQRVNLEKTDLSGAILENCGLEGATLREARLLDAILDHADLDGADLQGAELNRAILNDTRLADALLSGCKLIKAELNRVVLDDADLSGATLDMIELTRCSFRRTNFHDSQCGEYVTIIRCDFRDARLQKSSWPPSAKLERNRFKKALYNSRTKWPGGHAPPPDAINTDEAWRKRSKQLRHKMGLE
jgi:uncharacterized protein YjbI with pentapeptide repeats